MHPVDNPGDWLPNGLDVADVDGDGFPDLLVNYEWTGRIRVVFHPGPALSPEQPWPAVDAGFFPNAENAAFGDLDQDGIFDVVVVQGVEHSGGASGVRILFGLTGSRAAPRGRALHWEDGGMIPESVGLGHYLYVKVADLDGSGFPDVIVGGRAARPAGQSRTPQALQGLPRTGLCWFQTPSPAAGIRGIPASGGYTPSIPPFPAATGLSSPTSMATDF